MGTALRYEKGLAAGGMEIEGVRVCAARVARGALGGKRTPDPAYSLVSSASSKKTTTKKTEVAENTK